MFDVKIKVSKERKVIGKRTCLNLKSYNVSELWKSFLPLRKDIANTVSDDLFSISVYDESYFIEFSPLKTFEKWAAIEVDSFDKIPSGLEVFTIAGGTYAVFFYKGLNTDFSVFQYIYNTWLPTSGYFLDNRPHFEILGKKYKNNDPSSEEEIWIPLKPVKN